MATRNVANVPGRPDACTEFQLYAGCKDVIDYTERRLVRYAGKAADPMQKLTLCAMIDDYRDGRIAIAWRGGRPVFVKVTKES
jgi:hypothetical protein